MKQFEGFPPGGFEFFLELGARQSREWFQANRDRYGRLWVEPMEALLDDLAERLRDLFPEISAPRVMRIQRDIRFSADKSPYKTHIAAHLRLRPALGGEWSAPGIYLHFGPDEQILAMGQWKLDKEALARYRASVADERLGPRLQAIVNGLQADSFQLASHETLRRVPPPYPQDHPRLELLKRKGLAATAPEPPEELMAGRELLDWVTDRIRQAAPLAKWLEEALAKVLSPQS